MEILRTPDERFASLPGHPFVPKYAQVDGLRVHYVDEGVDTGAVIAAEAVPVREGDTVESLRERVHEAEHRLLPRVVAELCAR